MALFSGFICEKCNKEFRKGETDYNPVTIAISICLGRESSSPYSTTKEYVLWCRECVMRKGFHRPITESDKEVASERVLTFEEKFTEIIEDLGFIRDV